jgi:hypothetical protein
VLGDGSTVVEHSPRQPKVEGSSPAGAGKGGKMTDRQRQLWQV